MNANVQPYEGPKPYIFISYSHNDNVRVHSLLEALYRAGYRIWYDGGIQAGISWANSLAEHIMGCAVFMPLISSAYADSLFCHDETRYALTKRRVILPVYLEKNVVLPPGLEMALYQFRSLRYQDADTFALTLDAESGCAPCKDTPEPFSREAS